MIMPHKSCSKHPYKAARDRNLLLEKLQDLYSRRYALDSLIRALEHYAECRAEDREPRRPGRIPPATCFRRRPNGKRCHPRDD